MKNLFSFIFNPHHSRGSLTVEAAMVFPVFILLWIPFLYLVKYCILHEMASEAVAETASEISAAGYLFDLSGLKDIQDGTYERSAYSSENEGTIPFSDTLENVIGSGVHFIEEAISYFQRVVDSEDLSGSIKNETWKLAINEVGQLAAEKICFDHFPKERFLELGAGEDLHLSYSDFFYQKDQMTDLISIDMFVPIRWPDPFGFFSDLNITVSAKTRAFIGIKNMYGSQEAQQLQTTTYYRIGNGRKYHSLNCYLIQKQLSQISISSAKSQGLVSCEICHPDIPYVWISSGGLKYHAHDCPILFPELTALSESELQSGLYSPCELCQSDNPWFEH